MKLPYYTIVTLLVLGLYACNHTPTGQQVTVDVTDTAIVTERADPTDTLFNNPYRDINSFDAPTGYSVADSLGAVLQQQAGTQVAYKREECAGDCCFSYKQLTDSLTNQTLCFFKNDCYEYGFGNQQFFKQAGQLVFVRSFNLGIEQWPTDTTATTWSITETIWQFAGATATEQTRTTLTEHYTTTPLQLLANKPFTVKTLPAKTLRLQKEQQLTDLLNIKGTE